MPTAIIVGGGIAGLASAIALKRSDWDVEIFDAGGTIADPTSAEELDSEENVLNCQFRLAHASVTV